MSRRKADYVYVPKKKIKKIVIDATKGSKPVEKVITQQQILDGAYVRAAALKEFRNYNFGHGGMTKNFISVGDVVREKNSGLYFIVYEVKNGVATKSYVLPTDVGEAIAFVNDPSQIDLDKYTMYSDQSLDSKFSVGDMVYVHSVRSSGVIIGKSIEDNGNFYYTVKFASGITNTYNDASLELISSYKGGSEFSNGGEIKNQYESKTAREVWGMWTNEQRKHFLGDHYLVGEYRPESIAAISEMTYDELRSNMATISGGAIYTLEDHIMRGQYKRGGNIGSYNKGRSWAQDHYRHNKSESYEIPTDDRKFAKGGKIKNQYAGKTAREVWGMWTNEQRKHFLGDHYLVGEYEPESIAAISKMTYDELRSKMATISGGAIYTLEDHIMRGQYAKGGKVGEEIPDISNMNIDHLFADGGRTYSTAEEKIYS